MFRKGSKINLITIAIKMTIPKRGPQTSNGSKRPKASINEDSPESNSSNTDEPTDGFHEQGDVAVDHVKDGYYDHD